MTIFTVFLTGMGGLVWHFVRGYLKRREIRERQTQRRQELHFMKIDAIIYAIAASSDSVVSEVFQQKYTEQLNKLIDENRILKEGLAKDDDD